MRTLKWDPWFEPDMETMVEVAWILILDLHLILRSYIFYCLNCGQAFGGGLGHKEPYLAKLCKSEDNGGFSC